MLTPVDHSARACADRIGSKPTSAHPDRVDLDAEGTSKVGSHLRLALTQEAIDNLEAAFEGFKAHITAQKAPCVMPKAVELTPQGSACDHPDKKFPANEGAWDHPTWRTLGFAPKGQHRYRYRFEPHPDGNMPRFTVAAHGDLDCDGTLSTFERYGYMDTPAEDGSCRMRGSSAFYKDMETE